VDYAAGPLTAGEARQTMTRLAGGGRFTCPNPHAVVIAERWANVHRPRPSDDLDPEPFADMPPGHVTCRVCEGSGQSPHGNYECSDCNGWGHYGPTPGAEPFGVPDLEPHGCTGPGCRFCPGDSAGVAR